MCQFKLIASLTLPKATELVQRNNKFFCLLFPSLCLNCVTNNIKLILLSPAHFCEFGMLKLLAAIAGAMDEAILSPSFAVLNISCFCNITLVVVFSVGFGGRINASYLIQKLLILLLTHSDTLIFMLCWCSGEDPICNSY